jgi:hypothetical protein
MNLKTGKMRWQQGTLYLRPAGKPQFSPLYEFPEIVGSAEVDYACGLIAVNEKLEQYTKQKQREIKLSVGIGTYLKLLKRGWQLVQ